MIINLYVICCIWTINLEASIRIHVIPSRTSGLDNCCSLPSDWSRSDLVSKPEFLPLSPAYPPGVLSYQGYGHLARLRPKAMNEVQGQEPALTKTYGRVGERC